MTLLTPIALCMGLQGMATVTAKVTMALNKFSPVHRRMLLWQQTHLRLLTMEAQFKNLKQTM
jgi:hypothetical protein